ncbi:MAG: cytochrome C biogenesis protein CcsA [Thiomargarita sp.]|nr:cytochrome C biogenesis protein CcsA [Thiomargarita sp.]
MKLNRILLTGIMALPIYVQAEVLPNIPPIPADNVQSAAKIELGKILFFDPRLSSTGTVSCNSCHNVMAGGEDNRPNSMGVHGKTGGRSAPTVWNSGFLSVQFWDGRAASLEDQARGPVTNSIEMGMKNWDVVVERLKTIPGYNALFQAAFANGVETITEDNAVKAIAAYERTLVTNNSAYDQYMQGDKTALTIEQIEGLNTFNELGCQTCHLGANFSGPQLPIGQGWFRKFPTYNSEYDSQYNLLEDTGRYQVTNQETDKNVWRVPTLRNIVITAPYFHHGAVPTLDEAVRVMAKSQLNKDLTATQVQTIIAFLNSLTGEFPEQTMPRLPGMMGESVIK